MTRLVSPLILLAVVAVPVVGWFAGGWAGGTTLVVYWFETVAASAFICARILLHRRMTPRRGHFGYRAGGTSRRGTQRSSFLAGFAVTSFGFCAAHAVFLGAILFLLTKDADRRLAQVDWRTAGFGCLIVLAFLTVDFAVDLLTLRRWSFWRLEQFAHRGLSRVVVVHLTLIFGLIGLALTDAADALFGVFVVLKTLAAVSLALPQWEPRDAPPWLSRTMNRVPGVRSGERFEDSWTKSRAAEAARRDDNERPWVRP
ncbi:hypothetical protein CIW49_28045 [Mycolicibacterium sp. P1-18]|uniref:DUF6498-containing protein n=1 Tax=Mycolicibacterium sp. P1-18 TaxID=2024615 RepID=UPI0011F3A59D|nr:DUF6498-containing protein [Mycolicibacterium sp. P1-18]KAA0092661.1 hypothetical protein CIW49_28045 [Mycolicibacterium sp. P1-18]